MKVKYNLTKKELSQLKVACKVAGLSWRAQAARPAIARQLLNNPALCQKIRDFKAG